MPVEKCASYVYAHWRDVLYHNCDGCGQKHEIVCGSAKPYGVGGRAMVPRDDLRYHVQRRELVASEPSLALLSTVKDKVLFDF